MEERLKQRLVGAVVLVSLAVVFVPILFDLPRDVRPEPSGTTISEIPERPQDRSGSSVSITLDLPQTQRLDAEVERERSESDPDSNGGGVSSGPVATDSAATPSGAAAAPATPESSEPPASAARSDPSPAEPVPAAAAGEPAEDSERKQAAQTSAADGWTVQLGSFAKSENALALHKRLQEKGYPAFVESGSSAQGAVSRVFVGPMPDRRQARDSAAKLRREMALEGIVVPYPGG